MEIPKQKKRDDFNRKTIEAIAKRASYICSNPDCRSLTLYPSENDPEECIYIGKAAHITAASKGGPRHDPTFTPEQRTFIENGIFLCSNCADVIDKNNGLDFPAGLLREWKRNHEAWVKANLNNSLNAPLSIIDGEHHAKGKGNVTAIDAQEPVSFKPRTKAIAEGEGNITAVRIAYKKERES